MSSCLDDPQWADPESVEAIRWLLARAQGDQLLIVIGIQPAAGPMARAQSFQRERGTADPVHAHRPERTLARALIQARRPGLTEAA